MKAKYLRKQIEKHLDKAEIVFNGKQYFVSNEWQEMSWYERDGYVFCLNVRRLNDHADLQSDYSAGTYCYTVKQAILYFNWEKNELQRRV